jgi:uncharacterized damage-inducible protein DinB
MSDKALRDHLAVGFDKAVDGIPVDKRGARPPGFEHSPWQLLEHLRLAQEDILDFCVNVRYVHNMKWPDDYWPGPTPPSDAAWNASIASFTQSREKVKALARDVEDLTARVPTGRDKQTYLRAILLVADHAAYHVGQLVAARRALGIWK